MAGAGLIRAGLPGAGSTVTTGSGVGVLGEEPLDNVVLDAGLLDTGLLETGLLKSGSVGAGSAGADGGRRACTTRAVPS